MKKIGGIHTFEDKAFLRRATHASLAVIAGGFVVAVVWWLTLGALSDATGVAMWPFELMTAFGGLGSRMMGVADVGSVQMNPLWWILLAVVALASLVVHELVHGFFFRRFAPSGSRVSFGANLKLGMLYASAEGIVYTRQQYIVIALAPSIVVTLLLLAIGIGLKWPLWTIIVVTAHLSGCTGDWGYVRAIERDPSITHCEDTSWGVEFYGDDAEAPTTPDAKSSDETGVSTDKGFSVVDGGKSA